MYMVTAIQKLLVNKQHFLVILALFACFLLPILQVPLAVADNSDAESVTCEPPTRPQVITTERLTVLTLNLAHGRKTAFNQILQRAQTTRQNLQDIAAFLSQSGADLVALQEADYPSRWSGRFNHVELITDNSPYPCRIHAHHAQKYMYDFGTALLSRTPFVDRLEHTFEPSPPITNKGFVLGSVRWNPGERLQEPLVVNVMSVHLDFSRKKVREAQVEEIRLALAGIAAPLIILGDFNTDWEKDQSALRSIVENGKLKAYRPGATNLGTYKKGKHRLDWILITSDLEFTRYEVSRQALSDHQPVSASLRWLDKPLPAKESDAHE